MGLLALVLRLALYMWDIVSDALIAAGVGGASDETWSGVIVADIIVAQVRAPATYGDMSNAILLCCAARFGLLLFDRAIVRMDRGNLPVGPSQAPIRAGPGREHAWWGRRTLGLS